MRRRKAQVQTLARTLKFSNIFSPVFILSILCIFFSFQLIFLSSYLQRKNNQKLIGIVECEVF